MALYETTNFPGQRASLGLKEFVPSNPAIFLDE